MKADIRWLDDPQVFRVNRLDAHSDHKFYENKEDYKKQNQRLKQSLNGIWKFHYSVNALERPADFYQKWFNCKNFDEMKVPQHIELAGYDKIHYINTMYPWEGHIYRRPAGYGKEKGKIEIHCTIKGKTIHISVQDWGIGIEDIDKAMEPLYTTKPEWERSGMGFAFMEAFMDEVQVESVPGKGTTVWMKKTTGGEKKEAVWTTQSH